MDLWPDEDDDDFLLRDDDIEQIDLDVLRELRWPIDQGITTSQADRVLAEAQHDDPVVQHGRGRVASRQVPRPTGAPQRHRTPPPPRPPTPPPRPPTPPPRPPTPPPRYPTPPPPPSPHLPGTSELNFDILSDDICNYDRFEAVQQTILLVCKDVPDNDRQMEWFHDTFEQLIVYMMHHTNTLPGDRVQLEITSVSNPELPLFITPRRGDQLSVDVIASRLEKILNSNQEFLLAGPLRVKFSVIKMPVGRGLNRRISKNVGMTLSFDEFCKRKKSIINVKNNNDNMCLARALAIGLAHARKDECRKRLAKYTSMKRSETRKVNLIQRNSAMSLCRKAKVDLKNGATVDDVRRFQEFLVRYTITVWCDRIGSKTLFEGPKSTSTHPRKNIDLYFENNHYVVITSLTGVFDCNFFCRACKVGYHRMEEHKCPSQCPACNFKTVCDTKTPRITCAKCNRYFYGPVCYDNHFKKFNKKKTVCEAVNQCNKCLKVFNTVKRKKPHFCGEIYCTICNTHVEPNHLCYMQPYKEHVPKTKKPQKKRDVDTSSASDDEDDIDSVPLTESNVSDDTAKPEKIKDNFLYVFYDLEATQCKQTDTPNQFLHEPNLCVVRQHCAKCLTNFKIEDECENCGQREYIFRGGKCVHDFLMYLRSLKPFSKVTIIAHNGKGYDFQFCLHEMVVVQGWKKVEIINNGSKILCMKYGNLRWIDSLSFLSVPLSKLPKMMSIDGDIAKGHFPHLFNRPENAEYIGCIPSLNYFCPNDMSSDARKELTDWHAKKVEENYIFNFQHELEFYCRLDVEILSKACLKFRELFLSETGLDPFTGITVAQMCMKTFQKNFLKKDSIGIIPLKGYRLKDNHSLISLEWLDWLAHDRNISIQHSGNSAEKSLLGLNNVRVDGFCSETKTVFEFYGCYWHGCPMCFHSGRDVALPNARDETMQHRYEKTLAKEQRILNCKDKNGASMYKLESIWECEFNVLKSSNKDVQHFCKNNKAQYLVPPLTPSDAYFGGRTSSFKLYAKADISRGEKIYYKDFCSLYPYILARGIFPIGQVKKVLFGDQIRSLDISQYTGLIKCVVLPPDYLYHPLLPIRARKKLVFALCRTCAEEGLESDCNHSDEERCLDGTWVSLELQKAVSLGYKIVRIHEIWHFETTQFNGKTGGLFVDYVKKFLKMKQEASGWPSWCQTETDKQKYLDDYKRVENIELDRSKINSNPSLRSVSKILLNAFYGKLGQRNNFVESRIVSDQSDIVKILTNPALDVQSFQLVSNDVILINTLATNGAIIPNKKTNVILAAFVTAQSRLKLYELLEEVQTRAYYVDTDSIIYSCPANVKPLPTNDWLGGLTDECLCYGEGSYITEFIGAGPKSYAYKVAIGGDPNNVTTVCKVRGFTLNHRASKVVNFDSLKKAVLGSADPLTVHIPNKIVRKPGWNVVSKPEQKIYKVVYTKRRRLPDSYDTLPFGVKKCKFSVQV